MSNYDLKQGFRPSPGINRARKKGTTLDQIEFNAREKLRGTARAIRDAPKVWDPVKKKYVLKSTVKANN